MQKAKLLNIANDLSNQDICDLINMVAPRLHIYYGKLNMHCLSAGVHFAVLNGHQIQINSETAVFDDLSEDPFFLDAMRSSGGES